MYYMFALDAAFIISDFGFEEEMTMNHSEKKMEKVVVSKWAGRIDRRNKQCRKIAK